MNFPASIRVIKIGGSLLEKADLKSAIEKWANTLASDDNTMNLWLVGGGAAVDVIRKLDAKHPLPADLTHWSSLQMMDVNSKLLSLSFPHWQFVTELVEICEAASRANSGPWNLMLQPSTIVRELEKLNRGTPDALPSSWNVTSDSIAAWIGLKVGAFEAVLLKSCEIPNSSLTQLQAAGIIDNYLSDLPIDSKKMTLKCERLVLKTL